MGCGQSTSRVRALNRLMKLVKGDHYLYKARLHAIIVELRRLESSAQTTPGMLGSLAGALVSPFTSRAGAAMVGAATQKVVGAITNSEDQEQQKLLRAEFVSIIQSVREKLQQVESSITVIREEHSDVYRKQDLSRLEQSVASLSSSIASACCSKKTQQFEQVLTELNNLCGTN